MSKKKTTLNVYPETRDKLLALARVKKGPLKRNEHVLETADDIFTRLLREHEKLESSLRI